MVSQAAYATTGVFEGGGRFPSVRCGRGEDEALPQCGRSPGEPKDSARCGWCGSAYRSATRRATPEMGICWGCLRDEFPELVKASEGGDRSGDGEPRAA